MRVGRHDGNSKKVLFDSSQLNTTDILAVTLIRPGELSIIIGISLYMLAQVENGHSQLPFKNLYALSEAYDLGFEEYTKEVKDFQYKMRDYLSAL